MESFKINSIFVGTTKVLVKEDRKISFAKKPDETVSDSFLYAPQDLDPLLSVPDTSQRLLDLDYNQNFFQVIIEVKGLSESYCMSKMS